MNTRDWQNRCATISFRQLKLFTAVGHHGGIQRAASASGMSQPAATQALALLQDKISVRLLERGLNGTALTALGKAFHARTERIWAEFVSGNFLSALGVRPALGRFFLPAEANAPGSEPVVVISHDFRLLEVVAKEIWIVDKGIKIWDGDIRSYKCVERRAPTPRAPRARARARERARTQAHTHTHKHMHARAHTRTHTHECKDT